MALDTAKATVILRDITRTFDRAVQSNPVYYPNLCTIVPSSGADEKYGWLGDVPAVREWLGDRQFQEMRASTYVLANKLWEDSLLIPKVNLDDDRTNLYGPLAAMLGQRATQHPDKLLMQAIVAAESTACSDGQYFFDTDHAWGDSGTQDNDLTYAAATGTTPTVAEFKAAFRAAVAAMLGYKDDRGEPLNQPVVGKLSDITLLVPIALRSQAYDSFESNLLGGGDSNVVIDKPNIVVSPFLTDATKMYCFYTGSPLKPFVFQAREPLSRQMKGLEDIETKDVKFMTQARYNIGYLAWWNAVLTTFT